MGVTSAIGKYIPALNIEGGDRNFVREAWNRLSGVPGGKVIFSKMIGRAAPYTGTIGARVVELEHLRAKVVLDDRAAVRNHLRCVHAVALVNLAELTGNIALAYSMPDDARFIVAGLSIEYLKKARGRITGVCECPPVESSERREYDVPVQMLNEAGEVVATASLRTLVGPKKK